MVIFEVCAYLFEFKSKIPDFERGKVKFSILALCLIHNFYVNFHLIIFNSESDELVKSISDGARRKCPWGAK